MAARGEKKAVEQMMAELLAEAGQAPARPEVPREVRAASASEAEAMMAALAAAGVDLGGADGCDA